MCFIRDNLAQTSFALLSVIGRAGIAVDARCCILESEKVPYVILHYQQTQAVFSRTVIPRSGGSARLSNPAGLLLMVWYAQFCRRMKCALWQDDSRQFLRLRARRQGVCSSVLADSLPNAPAVSRHFRASSSIRRQPTARLFPETPAKCEICARSSFAPLRSAPYLLRKTRQRPRCCSAVCHCEGRRLPDGARLPGCYPLCVFDLDSADVLYKRARDEVFRVTGLKTEICAVPPGLLDEWARRGGAGRDSMSSGSIIARPPPRQQEFSASSSVRTLRSRKMSCCCWGSRRELWPLRMN